MMWFEFKQVQCIFRISYRCCKINSPDLVNHTSVKTKRQSDGVCVISFLLFSLNIHNYHHYFPRLLGKILFFCPSLSLSLSNRTHWMPVAILHCGTFPVIKYSLYPISTQFFSYLAFYHNASDEICDGLWLITVGCHKFKFEPSSRAHHAIRI